MVSNILCFQAQVPFQGTDWLRNFDVTPPYITEMDGFCRDVAPPEVLRKIVSLIYDRFSTVSKRPGRIVLREISSKSLHSHVVWKIKSIVYQKSMLA